MLEQHTEEALYRTEQGAVQHDRLMPVVVCAHVFEIEPIGQIEVALNGAELPGAADGIFHVDVDLGAVERSVAVLHLVLQPMAMQALAQRFGCLVPDLVGAN
ncbi:unannotated protein [freshwater metagenome]|uniref:Unannotated protein n=1 Tax=freshwater metagenome TaxID=449393 RepID=A0A6J6XEY1_9ZZZZ